MNLEPGDLSSSLFPHNVRMRKSFDFPDRQFLIHEKKQLDCDPPPIYLSVLKFNQLAILFFFLFVSYLYKFKKLKFIAEVQVNCQE